MTNVSLSTKKAGVGGHGGGVRGAELSRRSSQFEGRFGRMFRSLPPAEWDAKALIALGSEKNKGMTAEPEQVSTGGVDLPKAPKEEGMIQDDEENSGIPAGYTYLGQFIDHDITFDPASSLQKQNDVDGLVDFRTPRLDLDSLYGRGPEDQPYMYFKDENHKADKFRLGRDLKFNSSVSHSKDLPRFIDPVHGAARALIGDKRNDENVIVSQLHGVMLQFHNRLVDKMPQASFEEVQRQVRWHYQWIIVNDFLVKICGQDMVHAILPHLAKKNGSIFDDKLKLNFYKPQQQDYMPIEFAAAAYRFGHSMVRPIYRLNQNLNGVEDSNNLTPVEEDEQNKRFIAGRFFIFAGVQKRGLNGFDAFPEQWAIDWSLFFDINGSGKLKDKARVQPAYKIDPSLVNPLGFLPEFSQPALSAPASGTLTIDDLNSKAIDAKNNSANLAVRNLLRGMSMSLPSGQDVARAMGLEPIEDKNLRICKAVVKDWNEATHKTMATFANGAFKGKAPLWYYVLAEAMYEWSKIATKKESKGDKEPVRLGPVGGRIVAETLVGLLLSDSHSYLRQAPHWHPKQAGFIKAPYDMGTLIKFALNL